MESVSKGNQSVEYTYDDYGNIEDIYRVNSNNTETLLCSYVYDSYNQLTTVNDYEHSEQTTYTYNQAGNITRRNRYQMNASWVTTATLENVRYVYGDSEWKDLLTTYNGQTITYDAIGNPLSYRDGISLTWQKGRQLASYSDSSNNITYTYDASGMRTGKAVTTSSGATTNYSYVYENGMLQKMTKGSRILEFSYDASGTPVSIKYRSSATATPTYYYYGTNSRGDVVSLYNSDGSVAAIYTYDAYGKLLSVKTPAGIEITSETAIANLNPLRYRGYVYDNETGFYYLRSRYYDPVTCRFVNADDFDTILCSPNELTDKNLVSYCDNNPISRLDDDGYFWMFIGAGIGAIVSAAVSAVSQGLEKGFDNINWGVVGVNAASGAISGLVASTGVGIVASVAINAGLGVATYASEQAILGEPITAGGVVENAIAGGISGAIGGKGIDTKGLEQAWKGASKGIKREARRACVKYATKQIVRHKATKSAIISTIKVAVAKTVAGNISATMLRKKLEF